MSFDPVSFKAAFPLFSREENQSLIYLDNAATTQKPKGVIEAIGEFYLTANGNAHRSSHRLARAATDMVAETRAKAAAFLGAERDRDVVFTSGATAALNQIAYGLQARLSAGDEIILSVAEHHANLIPWQAVAKACGATLVFATVDVSDLVALVNERTKIIAITAASNSLGQVASLSGLSQIKDTYPDMTIVLDGSQLACHRQLHVAAWPCDFFVCSAHKIYGPTGMGLLYGEKNALACLAPMLLGGEMVERVDLYQSVFASAPECFEAGTSPLASIAGLSACLDFWRGQDRQGMEAHEQGLLFELHRQLRAICREYNELLLLTQPENNVGIATLAVNGSSYSMTDLGLWLDEHNIAVRVGDHCAQPLWRHLGVNNTLRISLSAYNNESDITRLIQSITDFLSNISRAALVEVVGDQESIDREVYSEFDWQALTRPQPWQKRYKTLLQWGKQVASKPQLRQPEYLVKGCEAEVWLGVEQQQDQYFFSVESDSAIVKGLAILLLCRIQGKTAQAILDLDVDEYFAQLRLAKHLSPSRVNGFYRIKEAIFKRIVC